VVSLFPKNQDCSHNKITDELIAGVDGEEGSCELDGSDKAGPDVEAGHQAEMERLRLPFREE